MPGLSDESFLKLTSLLELPKGIIVRRVEAHGASFWTRTARLDTEQDGETVQYFLKV